MLCLVGPPGFYFWIFYSSIQFVILLSPYLSYLCFNSFLHLDLYLL